MADPERRDAPPPAEDAPPTALKPRPAPTSAPAPAPPSASPSAPAPARTLLNDPVWDPPTILYTPKGKPPARRPAQPVDATAETAPAPSAIATTGKVPVRDAATASRAPARDVATEATVPARHPADSDDRTIRVPDKADRTILDVDDPTVRRSPSEPVDDPTVRRSTQEPLDDPTLKAQPRARSVPYSTAAAHDEDEEPQGFKATARWLLKKHGKKLWWLHTFYALGLGVFVATFAQKGFLRARFLAISLGVAWLVLVLFFRLFGTGARQDFATAWPGARTRFLVMTYVLKNLYQGMLFFLLPFYWKSATLDAPNRWFLLLLGACAVLATLDLVFDRVLMRWKILASIFYAVTLFACLNLVIPALLPDTRTLWTLLSAAGITVVGFAMMHVPPSALRHPLNTLLLAASIGAGVGLAYGLRAAVPPVPMYLSSAAIGTQLLPDGRLAMEVKAVRASVMAQLRAVTDVVVPGGEGDRLRHVWRLEGEAVYRASEEASRVAGPSGAIRLQSSLTDKNLPGQLVGHWSVDVETEDGQLVGRVSFDVTE